MTGLEKKRILFRRIAVKFQSQNHIDIALKIQLFKSTNVTHERIEKIFTWSGKTNQKFINHKHLQNFSERRKDETKHEHKARKRGRRMIYGTIRNRFCAIKDDLEINHFVTFYIH